MLNPGVLFLTLVFQRQSTSTNKLKGLFPPRKEWNWRDPDDAFYRTEREEELGRELTKEYPIAEDEILHTSST